MSSDVLGEAVELVLGVARLGEADLAGWWGSHGMDRVVFWCRRPSETRSPTFTYVH
jgi:hypothetical protein